MDEPQEAPLSDRPDLLVFSGTGPRPGVDLESNRATVEATDPMT